MNLVSALNDLLLKAKDEMMKSAPNSITFELAKMKIKEIETKLDRVLLTADL